MEFNKAYSVDMEVALAATGNLDIGSEIYYAKSDTTKKADEIQSLVIGVFPVINEGKKMVRYTLNYALGNRKPVYKASDFDSKYYEIDYSKFNKFVKLGEEPPKEKKGKDKKN